MLFPKSTIIPFLCYDDTQIQFKLYQLFQRWTGICHSFAEPEPIYKMHTNLEVLNFDNMSNEQHTIKNQINVNYQHHIVRRLHNAKLSLIVRNILRYWINYRYNWSMYGQSVWTVFCQFEWLRSTEIIFCVHFTCLVFIYIHILFTVRADIKTILNSSHNLNHGFLFCFCCTIPLTSAEPFAFFLLAFCTEFCLKKWIISLYQIIVESKFRRFFIRFSINLDLSSKFLLKWLKYEMQWI